MTTEGEREGAWERAAREADATVRLPGDVPMFFRRVPAGSFVMGSRRGRPDQEPRHRVVISHDYLLGTFVVTQEQYAAVARECRALENSDPSHFKGARRPVEVVNWFAATAFCAWLTGHAALPTSLPIARLPTEAEWERACRLGGRPGDEHLDVDYWSGDGEAALQDVGWHGEDFDRGSHAVDDLPSSGRALAGHRLGLQGLHGNVWEWCRDAYREDAYRTRSDGVADPVVPPDADRRRVVRGGAWNRSADACRSAFRGLGGARGFHAVQGFRVCLVPGPAVSRGEDSQDGEVAPVAGDDARGTRGESTAPSDAEPGGSSTDHGVRNHRRSDAP